ncbi:MAG: thiopurine S-methyltransferase [Ectothiorhodospiraceae bacterium]|nr:thiopurine S-methyltransferase [Chromatiales bacterium]MCP5157537.1 thiopurine S-methyltransferase [Ectothiorhodospiraceae bacterium]
MDAEFWHSRWESGNTPWHQGRVNARLERNIDRLPAPESGRVMVPLCGRAYDMRWLLDRGHRLLGVELSAVAVRGFLDEHGLSFERSTDGAFERFDAPGARMLCGDVFALTREHLAEVRAVYDRAALIALPPETRRRYAAHLVSILPPAAPMLVVTIEYPRGETDGPPFSVDEAEVRDLFEPARRVERVESIDVLDTEPGLARRGLSRLVEHAFLVHGG